MATLEIGNAPNIEPSHEVVVDPTLDQIINYLYRLNGIEYRELILNLVDKGYMALFSSPTNRFHLIYMYKDKLNPSVTLRKFLVDKQLSKDTQVKFWLSNGQRDSYSLYGTVSQEVAFSAMIHFFNNGLLLPVSELPGGFSWEEDEAAFDIY